MNMQNIKPQYTVETYIQYLNEYIKDVCTRLKMQGVLPNVIAEKEQQFKQAIDNTANLGGIERLAALAELTSTCFCQTVGDIHSTAVATIKKYCARDVIGAVGLEQLVAVLCANVPTEYWYATDMRESGLKTRLSWCKEIFPKSYHRVPVLKNLADVPFLEMLFKNIQVHTTGVSLFTNDTAVDVIDNNIVALKNVIMNERTIINPFVDTTLRIHINDNILLVRICIGDDSSGIKGRQAMFISIYSVKDACRYEQAYPIAKGIQK